MVVVDLDAYETKAPRRLVIEDFPVLILNGLHGGNLYHRAPARGPRETSEGRGYERSNQRDEVLMPDGDR